DRRRRAAVRRNRPARRRRAAPAKIDPVACCTSRLPEAGDVSEKGEPRQLGGNRRRLTTAPVASIVRVPMNCPGNLRRLGAIEIDGLRERALARTDEDWARESIRQQRYEVHRDTETIPLVYD